MIEYKAQVYKNGEIIAQISSYSMEGLEEQLHKFEKIGDVAESEEYQKGIEYLFGVKDIQGSLDKLTIRKVEPRKCELCEKEIPEDDLGWGLTDEPSDDRVFCSKECLDRFVDAMDVEGVDYV